MKGYTPDLKCKKYIETFSNQNSAILEIGSIRGSLGTCGCKGEECKNKIKSK